MKLTRFFICKLLIMSAFSSFGQRFTFTHDDTLRGSVTPQRAWWDLTFYHLDVRLNLADSTFRSLKSRDAIPMIASCWGIGNHPSARHMLLA